MNNSLRRVRVPSSLRRRGNLVTRRIFAAESLEPRVLLAGDALSAWQNPVDRLDVNGDAAVTTMDALSLIRDLNQHGPRELPELAAGEPESSRTATSYYPDVNGDARLTNSDLLSVIRALNAAGEDESALRIRLELTDLQGIPLSGEVRVGESVQLRAYVQDRRDAAAASGVFAAYVDVAYDAALLAVSGDAAIEFSPDFSNGTSGSAAVAGVLDEVGGFLDGGSGAGNQEQLLFTVRLDTVGVGTAVVSTNEADILPAHETLFFDPTTPVPTAEIFYGRASLAITAGNDVQEAEGDDAEGDGARDDAFQIQEDSMSEVLDVLANDGFVAADGAEITSLASGGLLGTAMITDGGQSITYTPRGDFFGTESFRYVVTFNGGSATAAVLVTVDNVDDPPDARDDEFPGDFAAADPRRSLLREDAGQAVLLPVLSNDTFLPDPETADELFTITAVTSESGAAVENAFNVLYTPLPDFFGVDTFTYTIKSVSSELTDTATVTVLVAEVNDPPTAVGESVSLLAGHAHVYTAAELLANDSPGPANESDQSLSIVDVSYDGLGAVTLTDAGNISYVAPIGVNGEESITYTIRDNGTTDGVDDPLTATAVLTVTLSATLTAVDDDATVPFASSNNLLDVLANDQSPQQLSFRIVTATDPAHGALEIIDNRRLAYTPTAGFAGADTFEYTIQDDAGDVSTATVTITVEAEPPTAVDDAYTLDASQTLDVLANDLLGIGGGSLIVAAVDSPLHGTAAVVGGGSAIDYQPAAGYTGMDSFTYTLADNAGNTDLATVTVTVTAGTTFDPFAFNDEFEVVGGAGPQSLDVLRNDTALPDQDELLTIVAITAAPQHGVAAISASGDLIAYTPPTDFLGVDTFVYQISDGNGGFDTGRVDVLVVPANAPPLARDDVYDVLSTNVQTIDVLSNDAGEEGETLRIVGVEAESARGQVEISGDGERILYTPPLDFVGSDAFTYTIDDGTGLTAFATVTVNVPDLVAGSFFSGFVFIDGNDNGQREDDEGGLAGVTVMLEGVDVRGAQVSQAARTSMDGAYRFDRLAPGEYTITQQQPALLLDGQDSLSQQVMNGDQFSITVSDQLITSGGNSFGERGLLPELSMLDNLASSHQPGLLVVLENAQASWLVDRGGWDEFETVELTGVNQQTLSILTRDSAGNESTRTLSLQDPTQVQVLGRHGDYTIIRVVGVSREALQPQAVDALFAA